MSVICVANPVAHRTATTRLTVLGNDGAPLAGREVTVAQMQHQFAFGNIGFDLIPLANGEDQVESNFFGGATSNLEHLAERYLELFNATTLPFYWRSFEFERGHPDTQRLAATARWFRDRGVAVKGHPLLWHTLAPQWLLPLSDDEVTEAIRSRISRDVRDFAGLIDVWDAINETVILPVFTAEENAVTRLAQRTGRLPVVKLAFDTARQADPNLTLILNDFNLSPAYERVIEEYLSGGIQIDGIGLQTHMHQGYRGEEWTLEVLDRFARFGLPLHLSETTLVSGHLMPPEIDDLNDYQIPEWPSTPEGEARQASDIERHYRTLFGHPAVQSITYWGLTDDGSWLGAPCGLLRADGSAKPSYDTLRSLIKGEWWLSPTTAVTDAEGNLDLDGYLGDHVVTLDGSEARFRLAPDAPSTTVTLG